MTLTEFLRARIAEDEARFAADPDFKPSGDINEGYIETLHERLRTECEVKRRIVAEHAERVVGREPGGSSCAICQVVKVGPWPCPTLRHLASVYAEHVDYREEWRS